MNKNNNPQVRTQRLFLAILFTAFFTYALLAWITSGPVNGWMLDFIDGWRLFHIDDAYRFFLVRSAWSNPDLYHWSYVQPVALLVDGTLSLLTGGNLLLMRISHAAAGAATLLMLWQTARHLDIRPATMLPALLILAFMPVYAFGFLSFNAENWLAFFFSLTLLALASQRLLTAVLLCSLLPLIRPEGIMPLASLALYLLYLRRWRLVLALLAPGMIYALWLLVALPQPLEYINWRLTFRDILNRASDDELRRPWRLFSTFNPLWLAPALLAPWHAGFRQLMPVTVGAAAWLLLLVGLVVAQLSFFEARYLLSILPLLTLAWAAGMQVLLSRLPTPGPMRHAIPLVLAILIVGEHLLQFDPVKHRLGDRRYPVAGIPAVLPDFLPRRTQREAAADQLAEQLHQLTHDEPRITQILVFNEDFFYSLSPGRLRPGVRVVYAPTSETAAGLLLDGGIYGIHPGAPQHNLYFFDAPHPNARHLLVYVGYLDRGWQPLFDDAGLTAYLLEFSTRPPETPGLLPRLR
ncbi:hypothetical protein [Isoalcanivorax indicus]|uniref:hypothetical protein n=1 Tax=Isoalcanivorax indicus TaxID=2202653 RepID=UPI000DB97CA6|nr:hypothetical protein [Isoalcanivorax indicus]